MRKKATKLPSGPARAEANLVAVNYSEELTVQEEETLVALLVAKLPEDKRQNVADQIKTILKPRQERYCNGQETLDAFNAVVQGMGFADQLSLPNETLNDIMDQVQGKNG